MGFTVPAILPSSREDLKGKLSLFTQIPSVERIQIDVVDGKFAGPASWPYTAPGELRDMVVQGEMLPRPDRIVYEMDLMCIDAERAAESWLALGATRLTFHAESVADLPRFLTSVRRRYGAGANFTQGLISFGIALNLGSDLALIEPCLDEVEYVQFMGIAHIGRQGQPFDERVFEKLRIFHARHPDVSMQVDGGVSLLNAKKLLSLGVANVVVGSSIARAKSPASALAAFEDLRNSYGV
ncbi:hypothetical protein HKL94_01250 [Candidatus Parcubacteria bacterium]|nr:hypothetical protein [Candidatus Parcubacteria bacterium]